MLGLLTELGRPASAPVDRARLAVVERWCDAPDRAILLAEDAGWVRGLAAVAIRERLGCLTPELLRLECGSHRYEAHAFHACLGFEQFGVDLRLPLE